MKKFVLLALPLAISSAFVFSAESSTHFANNNPSAAYLGIYGLNADSKMLDRVVDEYGIKDVDAGFILINRNATCNIDNITDGSGINPISGHQNEYQRFTQKGGKLGLVFGGAIGPTSSDPIMECDQVELYNLIKNSIELSSVDIHRVSFDIEHDGWRTGNFVDETEAEFYDKIAMTLRQLHDDNPNISLEITIPQYSGYWKRPYNNYLRDFLAQNEDVLDEYHLMTSASNSQLSSWVSNTMSKLGGWPKNKTIILLTEGNTNNNQFNAETLKNSYSQYAGMSTLITYMEYLNPGQSELHRDLNDLEGTTPPTNGPYNLTVNNQQGYQASIKITNDFESDWLNQGEARTYDETSWGSSSTGIISDQQNLTVSVSYWGGVGECLNNDNTALHFDFTKDTTITIEAISSVNSIYCSAQ
ncbi:hypothetical protein HQQ94_04195 [Shewanella sp. VB17]|uniref:hypothetical protein n=1 Tax=Shewanella sp. VB17 TaxID=2739432 RepID=UPI0015635155|nr:hypothetical protein [Shewanella sp. VB17]NRD72458.1 hypothetical protein [Shewanella sp. VB17]